MSELALINATILDEAGTRRSDIRINDGVIVEVGQELDGDTVIDVEGLMVVPGFVDLNADLGEPGREEAETVQTGSRSAALGGFTAVVANSDGTPSVDSPALVAQLHDISTDARCEVVPAAALLADANPNGLAPIGELARAGVRIFQTGTGAVPDAAMMRTALEYCSGVAHLTEGDGVVVAASGLDESLAAGGVMHEGAWSSRLGLPGSPAEAEEIMVARNLTLARLTGASVHIQSVSTARSVALVAAAKAEGLNVTADVSVANLCFDDSACAEFDTTFKLTPPLRSSDDVDALRAGVRSGTIDAVCSGHSPQTRQDKERPFIDAPAGALGLQTAFSAALGALDGDVEAVVAALSTNPARIARLSDRHGGTIEVGRPANLAAVDVDAAWTLHRSALASRSTNCPHVGRELRGIVRHTIWNGNVMVHNSEATR